MDSTVPRRTESRTTGFNTALLIIIIAIADTFGGLVQDIFPATLLLRTAMVGYLLVYILVSPTLRHDIRFLLLILTSYLMGRILVNYFVSLNFQVVTLEIGSSFKLLYFPLLYAWLHCQILTRKMGRSDFRRLLSLYGWLILASLVLGHLTGLGGTIGGRGVEIEAGKGFMIGANEVGLMLLLTAPFVGADVVRSMRSLWLGGMAQLVVYALAGLHVFTKSSLIAVLSSGFSVYRSLNERGRGSKWLIRFLLAGACAYFVVLFLQNLDAIEEFALNTFFSALLEEGLVAFLFRGRQDYISAIYPQLLEHDFNWLFLLFGAGEFFIRELSIAPLMLAAGEGTTFEMDFFDLVGSYGLVGLVLFGASVATLFSKAGPYRIPMDIKVAIFGVIVHAFLAGHVLFSPQVTTLLVLILLYFRIDNGGRAQLTPPARSKKLSDSLSV